MRGLAQEGESPTVKDVLDAKMEEGREEGEYRMQLKLAKKLLNSGMPFEKVAELTELPLEEVKKLQSEMD